MVTNVEETWREGMELRKRRNAECLLVLLFFNLTLTIVVIWKKEHSMKIWLCHVDLWACLVGIFLIAFNVCGGDQFSAGEGCQPGQVVLACVRRQAAEARGSKPASGIPPVFYFTSCLQPWAWVLPGIPGRCVNCKVKEIFLYSLSFWFWT